MTYSVFVRRVQIRCARHRIRASQSARSSGLADFQPAKLLPPPDFFAAASTMSSMPPSPIQKWLRESTTMTSYPAFAASLRRATRRRGSKLSSSTTSKLIGPSPKSSPM